MGAAAAEDGHEGSALTLATIPEKSLASFSNAICSDNTNFDNSMFNFLLCKPAFRIAGLSMKAKS